MARGGVDNLYFKGLKKILLIGKERDPGRR